MCTFVQFTTFFDKTKITFFFPIFVQSTSNQDIRQISTHSTMFYNFRQNMVVQDKFSFYFANSDGIRQNRVVHLHFPTMYDKILQNLPMKTFSPDYSTKSYYILQNSQRKTFSPDYSTKFDLIRQIMFVHFFFST